MKKVTEEEKHLSIVLFILTELRKRKRENLIYQINIDLLQEVVEFLSVYSELFDLLEYANEPTLQNVVPVYYTLYEHFQVKEEDSEILQLMKTNFLAVLTDKLWNDSIGMLHLTATFLDPSLRLFKFVKSTADREGYFSQIKESLLILGKELVYNTERVDITMVDAVISSSNNELDHSNLNVQPRKKINTMPSVGFKPMKHQQYHRKIKV